MKNKLKNLFTKLKPSLYEYYVLTLLSLGLPAVAYLYLDYRAGIFTFVLVQGLIGILAIRNTSDEVNDEVNDDDN